MPDTVPDDDEVIDLRDSVAYATVMLRRICTHANALTANAWLRKRGWPTFSIPSFYAWRNGGSKRPGGKPVHMSHESLAALAFAAGYHLCLVKRDNIPKPTRIRERDRELI